MRGEIGFSFGSRPNQHALGLDADLRIRRCLALPQPDSAEELALPLVSHQESSSEVHPMSHK